MSTDGRKTTGQKKKKQLNAESNVENQWIETAPKYLKILKIKYNRNNVTGNLTVQRVRLKSCLLQYKNTLPDVLVSPQNNVRKCHEQRRANVDDLLMTHTVTRLYFSDVQ